MFFLLMGIISAVILTCVLYAKYDSEDFFYITSYENGIKTTEYSPGFVIGMFVFMYVFAAAFIWLGIYMIRKGRETIVMSLGEVMVIEKDQHKDEHAVGHATERPGDNIHSASFVYILRTFFYAHLCLCFRKILSDSCLCFRRKITVFCLCFRKISGDFCLCFRKNTYLCNCILII